MPAETLLATFVQISDLHLGRIDPETQSSRVPLWLELVPWFDGLRGHQGESLVALERFFSRMQETESASLIVTGDITSCGSDDEYDTARTFLGADLQPPKGEDLGLRVPDWNERAVPGNHDHWPGQPVIFGGPPPELWSAYRKTPYVLPPFRLRHGFSVRFFGINTDADVHPYPTPLDPVGRLLARGSFRSQLAKLDNRFKALQEEKEVRVLLLHHSSRYAVPLQPQLKMGSASRRALHGLMAKFGISILLCGHTHIPRLEEFPVQSLGITRQVYEACCGATTILTAFPFDSTSIIGTWPERPWIPNSLLVHRILEAKGKLYWNSQVYFETPRGFELPTSLPTSVNCREYTYSVR